MGNVSFAEPYLVHSKPMWGPTFWSCLEIYWSWLGFEVHPSDTKVIADSFKCPVCGHQVELTQYESNEFVSNYLSGSMVNPQCYGLKILNAQSTTRKQKIVPILRIWFCLF